MDADIINGPFAPKLACQYNVECEGCESRAHDKVSSSQPAWSPNKQNGERQNLPKPN